MKKNISKVILMILCLSIFVLLTNMYVEKSMALSLNTNLVVNPAFTDSISGWTTSGDAKWHDFGGTYGRILYCEYNAYAYQDINISDQALRIDSGHVYLDFGVQMGTEWFDAGSTVFAVYYYNSSWIELGHDQLTTGADSFQSLNKQSQNLPEGTRVLRIKLFHETNGKCYFDDVSLQLKDKIKPTLLYTQSDAKTYRQGENIQFRVAFNEPVYFPSAAPSIKINIANTYAGEAVFSHWAAQSNRYEGFFNFTVPSTPSVNSGDVTIGGITGSFYVDDGVGNGLTVTSLTLATSGVFVDNRPPRVAAFATSASQNSKYKQGETIDFILTLDETTYLVNSGDKPYFTFGSGLGNAVYVSGNGGNTWTFRYTVGAGENTAKLMPASFVSAGKIKDAVGNVLILDFTNNITNVLSSYNIGIDTAAPVVAANPSSGSTFKKSHPVAITATDAIAGIDTLRYAWNTSPDASPSSWTSILNGGTTAANPSNTGDYYLYVEAKDKLSNLAVYKNGPYKYDNQPPTVTLSPVNTASGGCLQSVKIDAGDSHSGNPLVTYTWRRQPANTIEKQRTDVAPGQNAELPDTDGIFNLEVTARDAAGNVSAVSALNNQKIDRTGPTIAFSPNTDTTFKKTHTTNVSVSDEISGVKIFYYQWTNSSNTPATGDANWQLGTGTSGGSIGISNQTQMMYLHIKAEDNVGTVTGASSGGFRLDNQPPRLSITPNGDINRVRYDVAIAITDEPFSTVTTKYAVTGNTQKPLSGWLNYTSGAISLTNVTEDKYLHIESTDAAGNISYLCSNAFKPIQNPPTGALSLGNKYVKTNSASLTLTATDEYSSFIDMRISVDNNVTIDWKRIDGSAVETVLLPTTEAWYTLKVEYRGEGGLISTYTDTVLYDKTPPQGEISYSPDTWTNGSVTVTIVATDNISPASITYIEPSGSNKYVITSNQSGQFRLRDEAGNIATIPFTVNKIDKISPVVSLSVNGTTTRQKSVATTVTVTDTFGELNTLQYLWSQSQSQQYNGFESFTNGSNLIRDYVDGDWYLHIKTDDKAGNQTYYVSLPFRIDNTSPTATITYSPEIRTAQNVTATITFDEEGVVISNTVDNSNQYVFTDNGTFTFDFEDEAGNTGSALAEVDYIDRSLPTAETSINPEGFTNDDVKAVIDVTNITKPTILSDIKYNEIPVEESQELTVLNRQKDIDGNILKFEAMVAVNGKLTFIIRDSETFMETPGELVIDKIDKTAPSVTQISRTVSEHEWTNGNVTVSLSVSDNIGGAGVNYDSSILEHTFNENGQFDFTIYDNLGNMHIETVTVSNIDKIAPLGVVEYKYEGEMGSCDIEQWTNKNIVASISFEDDGLSPVSVTSDGGNSHVFEANGTFSFEYSDEAGNMGTTTVKIEKIDKTPPTGSVTYSNMKWTNQPITATLTAQDGENTVSIINNNGNNEFILTEENEEFIFMIEDEAGNQADIKAITNRIDLTSPELTITVTPENKTFGSVYVSLQANEPVTVIANQSGDDNNARFLRRFDQNGDYTFRVVDRAGNISEITAQVRNISSSEPNPYIEYSNTLPTKDSVMAVVKSYDEEQMLLVVNNLGNPVYTFTDNGEFEFIVMNEAGKLAIIKAVVNNIDKVLPVLSITVDNSDITNSDVTATINANKQGVTYYYNGNQLDTNQIIFTENGGKVIEAEDLLGNRTHIYIEVNNIDKEKPEISFEQQNLLISAGKVPDPNHITDEVLLSIKSSIENALMLYNGFNNSQQKVITDTRKNKLDLLYKILLEVMNYKNIHDDSDNYIEAVGLVTNVVRTQTPEKGENVSLELKVEELENTEYPRLKGKIVIKVYDIYIMEVLKKETGEKTEKEVQPKDNNIIIIKIRVPAEFEDKKGLDIVYID